MAMAAPQQTAMVAPQYAQPMSVPMAQPVVQQQGQMNAPMMVPNQMMVLPNQTVRCTCPNCHQMVQTAVTHEIGAGGWVLCLGGFCVTGSLNSTAAIRPSVFIRIRTPLFLRSHLPQLLGEHLTRIVVIHTRREPDEIEWQRAAECGSVGIRFRLVRHDPLDLDV